MKIFVAICEGEELECSVLAIRRHKFVIIRNSRAIFHVILLIFCIVWAGLWRGYEKNCNFLGIHKIASMPGINLCIFFCLASGFLSFPSFNTINYKEKY